MSCTIPYFEFDSCEDQQEDTIGTILHEAGLHLEFPAPLMHDRNIYSRTIEVKGLDIECAVNGRELDTIVDALLDQSRLMTMTAKKLVQLGYGKWTNK